MSQPPQNGRSGEVRNEVASTTPGAPMASYDHADEPFVGTAEHRLAVPAVLLGVMSLIGMPFLGPLAWILGRRAVREIDASSVTTYSNRGIAMAGMILGIIGTVFLVVVVVGLVVLVASIMVRSRQP